MRYKLVLLGCVVLLVAVFVYVDTYMHKHGDHAERVAVSEVATSHSEDVEPEIVRERRTVVLRAQSLDEVPMDIFTQKDLEVLDLSNNNLSGAIPAEVRHLRRLRVLDLSHNQLTGVPAEVGQLHDLEVLDLSHNQLTGLPHEIGNLHHLRTLDLRGNTPSEQDLEILERYLPHTTILVE